MTDDTLLSDQVFQLNLLLWALEDLPPAQKRTGSIRPVLGNAGYSLVAIGRRVQVPLDDSVIAALKELRGSASRSACCPDLRLEHSEHPVHVLVELKARGFSSDSSNKNQAFKLLISAFDIGPSLGVQEERRGHVLYGTVATDAESQATTLKELADRVRAEGVPSAPTAVLGFSMTDDGVELSSPIPSDLPDPAANALANPQIVLCKDRITICYPCTSFPGSRISRAARMPIFMPPDSEN